MLFYSKGRTNSLLNVTPVFVAKYIDMQFFLWKLEEVFFHSRQETVPDI